VGAQKHDLSAEVTDSGMVFIFSKESGIWKTVAKIEPDDPSVEQLFGRSVAVENDYVFVGAPKTMVQGKRNAGAVYSYTRTQNNNWQFHQLLTTKTGTANSLFGESLDVENDTLVVGAWHDDEAGENAGAVYLYSLITDQWQQSHKVMAPDASDGNKFGFRIDLNRQNLLVGSHNSSSWLHENSGAAYLFSKKGENWHLTNKYMPSRSKANAEFGRSVGLTDTSVLVGAEKSNFSKPLGGDTYIFFLDVGVE
jgi:phage pi2 protein 07